jgi:SWI/SNF-related matrix-associated actin-dependent regulator 1 of chromatin subfamily A
MAALPTRRKILVFAHHQEVVGALRTGLAKWNPAVVVGGSTPSERTAAINTFLHRPECRVFIGNIQAAGTALTLVGPGCACSDVFFAEASYSVGDNVQAACRVHRIGQRDAVVARFITARGTIDDRIQSILARKAADFNDLFN